MDSMLLNKANMEWEQFISSLSDDQRKELIELEQPIASNNLFYLYMVKDSFRFDQTLNRLADPFLYNQELISTVYNYYNERGLYELAYDYIVKAQQYLNKNNIVAEDRQTKIFANAITSKVLEGLKYSFSNIMTLSPDQLVTIVPDILNNKKLLNEFILNEVVQAGRIVVEKIHGVQQITHEDRYNDLLLAVLRLRFPIWGWEIGDQARMGHSVTGKSAGEIDLLVRCAGNTIALFEALILNKKNKTNTQAHVKKTMGYGATLDSYYMIIYYTGGPKGFNKVWKDYKDDAAGAAFPAQYAFDKTKGYEDLSSDYSNVASIKIAKSTHGSRQIYHIMIDLSR